MTAAFTQPGDPPLHLWHDQLVQIANPWADHPRLVQVYQQCSSTQDVARRLIQWCPADPQASSPSPHPSAPSTDAALNRSPGPLTNTVVGPLRNASSETSPSPLSSASVNALSNASISPSTTLAGAIIVADQQTQGRGRRGHRWHSAPGGTLTFSLLQPFDAITPSTTGLQVHARLAALTQDIADAIRTAVLELACACEHDPNPMPREKRRDLATTLRIKAPNDVMVGKAKLAGVLIETAHDAAGKRLAIIGIGINVHHAPLHVGHATSLADQGIRVNRLTTLMTLIQNLTPG